VPISLSYTTPLTPASSLPKTPLVPPRARVVVSNSRWVVTPPRIDTFCWVYLITQRIGVPPWIHLRVAHTHTPSVWAGAGQEPGRPVHGLDPATHQAAVGGGAAGRDG
jgi:hypothetical protein